MSIEELLIQGINLISGPDSSVPGIGHTEEDLVTANEKTDDSNA
jgi:hypothetical protein